MMYFFFVMIPLFYDLLSTYVEFVCICVPVLLGQGCLKYYSSFIFHDFFFFFCKKEFALYHLILFEIFIRLMMISIYTMDVFGRVFITLILLKKR